MTPPPTSLALALSIPRLDDAEEELRAAAQAEPFLGLGDLVRTIRAGGLPSPPAYVRRYRAAAGRVVDAAGAELSAASAGMAMAMLDGAAPGLPFSACVDRHGPRLGPLRDIVARTRALLGREEPGGCRPAALADVPAEPEALAAFLRAVHRELAGTGNPLEEIADTFGLSGTELAGLFGVTRQAVDRWRAGDVPAARVRKVQSVAATAELLRHRLRAERIPGIARRPADEYGGASMLDMIRADRHADLHESVRRSFDWAAAA